MSLTYQASDGASPDKFWGPKYLSNRDITGQAPIDKAVFPGTHITSACFSDGVYDADLFQTCFSNLLAVGYRRLIIDLYWSASNQEFQLCPASIPQFGNSTGDTEVATTSQGSMNARDLDIRMLYERQTTGSESNTTATAASNTTTSTDSMLTSSSSASSSGPSAQPTTTTGDSGLPLVSLGPYRCSAGLSLTGVVDIMHDYIDSSSDASAATLQILELNLHSASASNDPSGPAQNVTADDMPPSPETVGYTFWSDLGTQIYRPGDLFNDRKNLNQSWFQVRAHERLPMTGYFNVGTNPDGTLYTDDGWPSELYLLLNSLNRALLVWGSISPEMDAYNLTQDQQYIFPSGYLSFPREIEQSATGAITSGCFYSNETKTVSTVNNTWALATTNSANTALQPAFPENKTACGVTPVLNATLNDTSASDSFRPYRSFTESILIGWAPGEPVNASSPGADVNGPSDQFRCVIMDVSTAYRGKWKVINCQQEFRVACRVGWQPFNWRLSNDAVDFSSAPDSCPEGSSFDVPVSQLENTYLYEHVLADHASSNSDNSLNQIWINLNSLASENCWVTTGPNGTCRYQASADEQRNREVLIPTIGAIIILVLTVLTILVKCNVHRRNNRKHRIGPGGWEYEGVPS